MSLDESDFFDIDVDLAPLMGHEAKKMLVSDSWYRMVYSNRHSTAPLQVKCKRLLRNAILEAQWNSRVSGGPRRRRQDRARLLTQVKTPQGDSFLTTDISSSGLRCSGNPGASLLDISFKLPGCALPISAKVSLSYHRPAALFPMMGLRFVDLKPAYLQRIDEFVERKRRLELGV
jgi:hypothetical protein